MKKSQYTEEQIAFALQQAEHGTPVKEVIRKMGITEQTFYRWKKKYGGLGTTELRRMKQLEEENRWLKRLVADLSLDKAMLQDVALKKALRPDRRRRLVEHLRQAWDVSERRACGVLRVHRSLYRYQSRADDQAPLRLRIREIAFTRVRYGGYKRIHVLLRREGWQINHKRVYRLYCLEGLNLHTKRPRRRRSAAHRRERVEASRPNECWSMDFMSGNLPQALAAYNWGPGNLNRNPNWLPEETMRFVRLVKVNRTSLTKKNDEKRAISIR